MSTDFSGIRFHQFRCEHGDLHTEAELTPGDPRDFTSGGIPVGELLADIEIILRETAPGPAALNCLYTALLRSYIGGFKDIRAAKTMLTTLFEFIAMLEDKIDEMYPIPVYTIHGDSGEGCDPLAKPVPAAIRDMIARREKLDQPFVEPTDEASFVEMLKQQFPGANITVVKMDGGEEPSA